MSFTKLGKSVPIQSKIPSSFDDSIVPGLSLCSARCSQPIVFGCLYLGSEFTD